MRLPVSKVYRAFPELDRFDDLRCEAYVRTVRRAQGGIGLLIGFAHVLLGVATTLVMMIVFSMGVATATTGQRVPSLVPLGFLVMVVAPALGAFVGFGLRDRRLRRLLRSQIEQSRCPECSYLPLGLVPADGSIRCPECGGSFTLAELGLTAADISMSRGLDPSR
ncbi:MAG: hypothetical protein IT438_01085 [Phycisphaerales bacterium]|nr:hypothetical protein [Phycisphaerales bacterium]